MAHKRAREEACATCGHVHDYEGGEPCSICGHTLSPAAAAPPRAAARPGALPGGRVFFGSYDNAARCDLLKGMHVSHVVNTVPTCDELYRNTFKYISMPTTPPDLGAATDGIAAALASSPGAVVFVYCMSGASRAPSVAAAWLMRSQGASLEAAAGAVAAARPGVALTAADAANLAAFATALAAARARSGGVGGEGR